MCRSSSWGQLDPYEGETKRGRAITAVCHRESRRKACEACFRESRGRRTVPLAV